MTPDQESKIVEDFLAHHFGIGFISGSLNQEEDKLITGVLDFVAAKFPRSQHQMGLALDMALLAQQLSFHDAEAKPLRKHLSREALFQRYYVGMKVAQVI